jgi:dipeptidyl aminopeptidase/acylaminoacyl peptidase
VSGPRPGASFAIVSKSSLTAPPEIFRASADGKSISALTHENASWLKEVSFPEPESLTATGAAGQKIQYWLIKPPQFDQGLQMFTVLRRNGVPSQALVFPDEGHWVLKALNSRAWHEAVFGWMKKYLATSS